VVVPSALELDRLPRPWPAILLAAQGVYLATLLARLELVGY
jgi:hypothetical protein